MIWKYFIIHPIEHLVSLSTEHRHYLRANPKGLIMQYHFLECDVRKPTMKVIIDVSGSINTKSEKMTTTSS
jgi:hypothetical protein